jgi:hypothetical protein
MMAMNDAEQHRRPMNGLTIPWSWLSAGLAIMTVGSLGTLAVVVTVNKVDTLSTIALALAVLAFAAQLIVSLAQGMAGAQQIAQVERVNADTQSALSALRATSDALLTTQRDQFGQVLSAALARAVPDAVHETLAVQSAGDGSDPASADQNEALQQAILTRVEDLLRHPSGSAGAAPSVSPKKRRSPRYEKLKTFPEESRGRELTKILKAMTPWEAQYFRDVASRALKRSEIGSTGAWVRKRADGLGPANIALAKKGLITYEERSDESHPRDEFWWSDITDLGVEVASLMVAAGDLPDWLVEEMRQA